MLEVCPTDIVHAAAERIWDLVTMPAKLAAWTGTTIIEAPDRELRAGDRLVLGGLGPLHVICEVGKITRPTRLTALVRLPFGITNDELIEIIPTGPTTCRVTFN